MGEWKMKEIKLNKGFIALVDDDDFDELSKFTWFVEAQGYAVTKVWKGVCAWEKLKMHRFVMKRCKGDGIQVDHINGLKLDNRKSNLRNCTNTENCRNRSATKKNSTGLKGVSFRSSNKKWVAQICVNYKRIYLGQFETPQDAHEAYKKAAIKMHGEFFSV